MNMFKSVDAENIEQYISQLDSARREEIQKLDALIREAVPNLTPYFATNMLGYGSFPYVNYKKEEIQWPTIALASQKNYISIYVCAVENGVYIAEKFKNKLGKVSVGKSCIRFKKIEDIDLSTLKNVLQLAEKHPGFNG